MIAGQQTYTREQVYDGVVGILKEITSTRVEVTRKSGLAIHLGMVGIDNLGVAQRIAEKFFPDRNEDFAENVQYTLSREGMNVGELSDYVIKLLKGKVR